MADSVTAKRKGSPTLPGFEEEARVISRLPKQDMMQCSLIWYATSAYQKLQALDYAEVKEVGEAASEISLQTPLHMAPKEKFSLPHIGDGLSGLQVLAYLAVSVDVLSNYQITDNDMTSFTGWLLPAREMAGRTEMKDAA